MIGIGMGLTSTVFIVSIQATVPWRQRGAATSSAMFMRFVGQSTGAALWRGAECDDTGLDPGGTRGRPIAGSAHPTSHGSGGACPSDRGYGGLAAQCYLLVTGFALLTLLIAWQLPARLSPTHQTKRP